MWHPRPTFDSIGGSHAYTRAYSATAKSRFYQPTGQGRDDYIFGSNGGVCPQSYPCKIQENGEFVFQKQRHINTTPSINSKS